MNTHTSLSPRMKRAIWIVMFLVVAALPVLLQPVLGRSFNSVLHVLILAAYYAIAALGLNIIVGYCGLLNLGFGGFMLIGAYTSGILMKHYEFSYWTAAAISVAHGALWGILLGLPTLRLTGDYFAIVTFGFGELVNLVALNWVSMTRGPRGYPNVPQPSLSLEWLHNLGIARGVDWQYKFTAFGPGRLAFWFLVMALLGLCMFAADRLRRSRLGRAWQALREDELAAEACGINAMWYKTIAFAISAGMGALAGSFLAAYSNMADYRNFDFMISVSVLAYLVLGGMGTVAGPVLGAFLLVSLGEVLRNSPAYYAAGAFGWWPGAANWLRGLPWAPDMRLIFYGAILIIMIRFRPEGLLASRSRARELHGQDREEAAATRTSLFSTPL